MARRSRDEQRAVKAESNVFQRALDQTTRELNRARDRGGKILTLRDGTSRQLTGLQQSLEGFNTEKKKRIQGLAQTQSTVRYCHGTWTHVTLSRF